MEPGRDWFDQIYKDHWPKLRKTAIRLLDDRWLAEDIVQNVFCTLWLKREQLKNHPNISGWLFRALSYQISNETKKAFHSCEVELNFDVPDTGGSTSKSSFLDSLPEGLSEDERQLLYLFYDLQFSQQEIAARLHCSPEACRMRIYWARNHYKRLYKKTAAPCKIF